MKIRFIRPHAEFNIGDEVDVNSARAQAFVSQGLAEMRSQGPAASVKQEIPQEKVEVPPQQLPPQETVINTSEVKEKNDKAGPGRKKK